MTDRRRSFIPLLAAILTAGALFLAACGSSDSSGTADQIEIDGSWKGTLKGSGNATFEAYVEVDTLREGSVSGTVYFPGIGGSGACSGALIYKGREGEDYLFTEQLVVRDNPSCIKLGDLRLSAVPDDEAIDYSWKSGSNTASGTLQGWDD
jgi:hypothetical protein